jgi:hypothetical protein
MKTCGPADRVLSIDYSDNVSVFIIPLPLDFRGRERKGNLSMF